VVPGSAQKGKKRGGGHRRVCPQSGWFGQSGIKDRPKRRDRICWDHAREKTKGRKSKRSKELQDRLGGRGKNRVGKLEEYEKRKTCPREGRGVKFAGAH